MLTLPMSPDRPSIAFRESRGGLTVAYNPSPFPNPKKNTIREIFRVDLVAGFSDKYLSIFAPFAIYWLFSAVFHLVDVSGWFEAYRLHEPEEEKAKNRVTVKQVIWAVLLQQAIQTALALVWLEDDDPTVGPFRDHAGDILKYVGYTSKIASVVLGQSWGSTAMKQYGAGVANWMYWWGVPVFQFFFAS